MVGHDSGMQSYYCLPVGQNLKMGEGALPVEMSHWMARPAAGLDQNFHQQNAEIRA